ncbi:MAG: glycine cleavage system protein GcvH [Alphaproteobacteria bacterium]|jgi:glycine cleavage system H protein|uniref:glycine cleavage system protein GcvH n=1 Tax=Pacificispira sp. TaxID=2888761 RepID=UPI001B255054|nr:glycine cleavage system protein GcvH [Alphaproteobacteria bacterium]MBO6864819.1 glycine cleavage system protein GcvH [Alphaproteobacteria bacterium]MEC9268351.1 glycine cleavage system protein GcvH [Pseudomonadota bacterium]
MAERKYSEEHEWIEIDGDIATVGITNHAQEQLGDIVFVELPEVGATLNKDDEAGVVESVKAASEVYAPIGGEITEVNEALTDNPGTVNEDAEGDGWFFKMTIADPGELKDLMSESEYKDFIED